MVGPRRADVIQLEGLVLTTLTSEDRVSFRTPTELITHALHSSLQEDVLLLQGNSLLLQQVELPLKDLEVVSMMSKTLLVLVKFLVDIFITELR